MRELGDHAGQRFAGLVAEPFVTIGTEQGQGVLVEPTRIPRLQGMSPSGDGDGCAPAVTGRAVPRRRGRCTTGSDGTPAGATRVCSTSGAREPLAGRHDG
jgi:hypothetical protein